MSDTFDAASGSTPCCDMTTCCGGTHKVVDIKAVVREKTVEVFDPPMCCSSGVCGPEPSESLTRFAADLSWLKSHGVQVHRYNLAQEPARFIAHPRVRQVVEALGVEGLPVVLVDGALVSQGEYPSRAQLLEMSKLAMGAEEHNMSQELVLPEVTQTGGCCDGGDGTGCC